MLPLSVLDASQADAAVGATPVSAPSLVQASDQAVVNHSGTAIQQLTHVETDSLSWGSTIVSAYQDGRTTGGFGAAAIGFATSTDDGRTWSDGLLPGLTTSSPNPDPANYPLVVNQSVAYDAAHATWLIPSVTYVATGGTPKFAEKALLVNTSADGLAWNPPVTAVGTNVDKAWGVCDNTASSPHYGTCYVAYSQIDSGDALAVVRSSNGGATWSAPVLVGAVGYNVVPVVLPGGNLVLVATDLMNGRNSSQLLSFVSGDAGVTWGPQTVIDTIAWHDTVPSGVRALNKPTADVDAAGNVTVVWADCRFETACSANDLVRSTSVDGTSWTGATRLPLQPASPADQFAPGVAIAPGTAGATAQISVVYYTLAPCSTTCVDAEYATSYDDGVTWSPPYQVNSAPMPISWFANSPRGRMVGDYNSVSFVEGSAVTVVPLAAAAPTNPPQGYSEVEWALALPPGFGRSSAVLTVATSGAGTGAVTSTPAGISCGSDCSETYVGGTSVTLVATATAGSHFEGWSGDCTGAGPCTVTMDAARSVVATFSADPPSASAPDTRLTRHPHHRITTAHRTVRAKFKFVSTAPGATFDCRIDKSSWTRCSGAAVYKVRRGKHTFRVRATTAGLTDPTPARFTFRVRPPR